MICIRYLVCSAYQPDSSEGKLSGQLAQSAVVKCRKDHAYCYFRIILT